MRCAVFRLSAGRLAVPVRKRRAAALAVVLLAGLALPSLAEEEHSIPEPIVPPVAGALFDGFARIVSNGDTIAAFHTDHVGRFTTTLQLTPGIYLLFPDCRGGVACENLRFVEVMASHLSPTGKPGPAQALGQPFKTLTIDTSGIPGTTTVRFTGRVESARSSTPPATIKVGGKGFILIPGIAAAPPPSGGNGGGFKGNDGATGRGTTGNY